MTGPGAVDPVIASYFDEGPTELPAERRVAISTAAERIPQRRGFVDVGWDRRTFWLVRAAVVVVLIVLTSAMVLPRLGAVGEWLQPEPTAVFWTPGAVDLPYPAPLRPEPLGGGPTVEGPDVRGIPTTEPANPIELTWVDPVGDGRPGSEARVDLVNVEFYRGTCGSNNGLCVFYRPSMLIERPLADPQAEWMAFGMVLDNDGDGQADGRFGIDNVPGGFWRAWHTDLGSGRTKVVVGGPDASSDGFYGESEFPFSTRTTRAGRGYMWLRPGLVTALGQPNGRFYLWAAAIRDGRMVSLDFAPDVGWLQAVPEGAQ